MGAVVRPSSQSGLGADSGISLLRAGSVPNLVLCLEQQQVQQITVTHSTFFSVNGLK